MKDQLKIPEGYTPIEYIEYHPKQTHLFSLRIMSKKYILK